MTAVFWTPQARDDLAGIFAHIAQDSEHYALLTVRALIAAPAHLAQFPESGRPDVRELTVPLLAADGRRRSASQVAAAAPCSNSGRAAAAQSRAVAPAAEE